ncbi:hypothetical protein GGTG_06462 [Gaeumannomyces tritici R3-111a-1]|uniref:Uncharacterized protein n=1 Tax=Gaeumannomyces tritici (strain R3-111a-1) TaxID=644352 RepID=J3NYW0_GAET3|nr:hypothetical protein GGTG_06462 [Gaeumannomyces tritici R3-111a-1]EJT76543.1 hypothetical protein GGTG_06462 [Gaeumannomyces tritici R3-111a-1]
MANRWAIGATAVVVIMALVIEYRFLAPSAKLLSSIHSYVARLHNGTPRLMDGHVARLHNGTPRLMDGHQCLSGRHQGTRGHQPGCSQSASASERLQPLYDPSRPLLD